jgi:uncharacterized membrane protein (GlpM family)
VKTLVPSQLDLIINVVVKTKVAYNASLLAALPRMATAALLAVGISLTMIAA